MPDHGKCCLEIPDNGFSLPRFDISGVDGIVADNILDPLLGGPDKVFKSPNLSAKKRSFLIKNDRFS